MPVKPRALVSILKISDDDETAGDDDDVDGDKDMEKEEDNNQNMTNSHSLGNRDEDNVDGTGGEVNKDHGRSRKGTTNLFILVSFSTEYIVYS